MDGTIHPLQSRWELTRSFDKRPGNSQADTSLMSRRPAAFPVRRTQQRRRVKKETAPIDANVLVEHSQAGVALIVNRLAGPGRGVGHPLILTPLVNVSGNVEQPQPIRLEQSNRP